MKCVICEIRKPRRYCPGVRGDICSICCGNEREVTVDCPLDCPYLREARLHEKPVPVDEKNFPNQDVAVTDAFLRAHQELLVYTGFALSHGASKTPEAVDRDVRDALDTLTQTYRTLSTGLYYESRSPNPYANRIISTVQEGLTEYREQLRKDGTTLRDQEILGILVMFQRLAMRHNNGRPKGRAFIDFLDHQFQDVEPKVESEPSGLIEL